MRRFFVETVPQGCDTVSITGREARHAFTVLRLRRGDLVGVFDDGGDLYEAIIEEADPRRLTARIKGKLPSYPYPCDLILCQSLLKADRFEYVIEKASELGVKALHPFVGERTVVRPSKGEGKMRRWKEIAKAAAKQSGRGAPMSILEPAELIEVLQRFSHEGAERFLVWEGERQKDLRSALKEASSLASVVAVVGPEGGFSDKEAKTAMEMGFEPVSLGYRILRADTAAVTVVAAIQYETGGLGRSAEASSP
jgi:16S rRNA (uracil1498-N3)-methyltransferase